MEERIYLSVPNDHNWIKLHVINGTIDEDSNPNSYDDCVWVNAAKMEDVALLNKKVEKIKAIFEHPSYELADGSRDFFCIYVESASKIKTIKYKLLKKEVFNNQECYTNNYFKNESEVADTVLRIKTILEI